MSIPNKITVVYLLWVPAGIDPLKNFIRSYCEFNAGVDHDLCIVVKDSGGNKGIIENMFRVLQENEISFFPLYLEGGIDIDAYFFATGQLNSEYLFFLNTSSDFLAGEWLKKYFDAFILNDAALISATASYQSYYSSVYQKNNWRWEKKYGFLINYRKFKLFIKAFLIWRFLFKPFPNPSIRTNAFMVKRSDFLKIYPGTISTKFKAYRFESGRKSMTNYFIKKGMKPLVIDKNGKTYEIEDWIKSSTFWIDDQENLLVSDNQTEIYRKSSNEERKLMTKLAWGI